MDHSYPLGRTLNSSPQQKLPTHRHNPFSTSRLTPREQGVATELIHTQSHSHSQPEGVLPSAPPTDTRPQPPLYPAAATTVCVTSSSNRHAHSQRRVLQPVGKRGLERAKHVLSNDSIFHTSPLETADHGHNDIHDRHSSGSWDTGPNSSSTPTSRDQSRQTVKFSLPHARQLQSLDDSHVYYNLEDPSGTDEGAQLSGQGTLVTTPTKAKKASCSLKYFLCVQG